MKTKFLFIAIVTSIILLSFDSFDMYEPEVIMKENTLDPDLEIKKTHLVQYFSDLIKNEMNKRFNESKNGNINEKEMFNSVLLSFSEYSKGKKVFNVTIDKNTLDLDLEKKKAILAKYYSGLLEDAIDKSFNENKTLTVTGIIYCFIDPEYGCAYSDPGCSGTVVCGVSLLYAETFGYSSFFGEDSNECESVDNANYDPSTN